MVSKVRLRVAAALAGLMVATALICDAAYHQLWFNLIFASLVLAGCLAFLIRLEPPSLRDPPVQPLRKPLPEPGGLLADHVSMPLLEYGEARGLVALNRAARSLFRTDDVVSRAPEDLMAAIRSREAGPPRPVTLDGRTYAVGVNEVATADTRVRLISLTDIQSEIRVAEATALRDLLRVLSHEIMNSLTPVASLARIARDYLVNETTEASRSAREALDVLAQRAGGLARFVEAYRSMAGLPEPVLHPVETAPFLRDIVRVFERSLPAANIDIEWEVPTDCVAVELDEALLAQALLNLLTNAAEAAADPDTRGRVRLSAVIERDELQLLVSDNGCGVPDDLAVQMFHAFVTTKAEGTGTGLNLARQIALAHGGDLVFLGATGPWSSVFRLSLPLSPGGLGAH